MPSYQNPADNRDPTKPQQIGGPSLRGGPVTQGADQGGGRGPSDPSHGPHTDQGQRGVSGPPIQAQPGAPIASGAPISSPSPDANVASGSGIQAQNVGTGFMNLQNVLSANAPEAKSLAAGLANNANKIGAFAQGEGATAGTRSNMDDGTGGKPTLNASTGAQQIDPHLSGNKVKDSQYAQDYANNLNSMSGLQSILQDQYKGQVYTPGQSSMDAFLAGSAGRDSFQRAQSAYGKLADDLQNSKPAVAQAHAPVTASATPPSAREATDSLAPANTSYNYKTIANDPTSNKGGSRELPSGTRTGVFSKNKKFQY